MTTTSTSTAGEGQIRAVIADRAAAMRERDAGRFVAHYAPQIVKFDLPPPLVYTGPKPATRTRC
jgi:ketosteroid isomerase-like protein